MTVESINRLRAIFSPTCSVPRPPQPVYISSLPNADAQRSRSRRAPCHHPASRKTSRRFLRKWDRKDRALYFCTATVQAGATTRSKETLAELNGLHIDIDFKSITISPDETERKLQQLMLLPSKVVASGGGLHAYWLFKEALPATAENIERVEALAALLADHLGGDPACAEAAADAPAGQPQHQGRRLDRSAGSVTEPAAALRDRRAYRMAGGGVTGNSSQPTRRQWRQRRRCR